MSTAPYWQILLPGPLMMPFTYAVPEGMPIAAGARVRVPFGKGERIGIAWARASDEDMKAAGGEADIRPVSELLDEVPLLDAALIACIDWAARYYHYPQGEAALAAFPPALRSGRTAHEPGLRLTAAGAEASAAGVPRGARQQALLARLAESPDQQLPLSALTRDFSAAIRRAVLAQEWCVEVDLPIGQDWPDPAPAESLPPELTPDQRAAVDAVRTEAGHFAVWLLEGVTGSGKTEVYLSLAEVVLAAGRQVLVLVPEIALTPQLIARFRQRLGVEPAVLHSGLTDTARLQAWSAVRSGRATLVIGTRSAVFQPFSDLGLIVVDEEHDPALKQQEGFGYHARDVAVWRARQADIPIVLGSATPSLESLQNRLLGRYRSLSLPARATGARMPSLRLLDIRAQRMRGGLSDILVEAVERHLTAGGQVMLYLNRRGYAPNLLCHECGWVAECRHCDAFLTWHRRQGVLRCHHCGFEQPVPHQCPSCATSLTLRGLGTEQLEDVLTGLFPEFGVERLDRDATGKRGELDRRLARIRDGEARIVVGTQMLVKGHDFPRVTLVGVVDADQGLFASDFRGPERFAQQLVQVAGRAGRADRPGEVLIQTHHPDHPALLRLLADGYDAFAEEQLGERGDAGLPPYKVAALIRADGPDADAVRAQLQRMADLLAHPDLQGLECWGPVPSPLARRAARYRFQLLVLAQERGLLHRALSWLDSVIGSRRLGAVRWTIDVDPVDMG